MSEQRVDIYTDGGCRGNPGPGAWAFYVPELEYHETGFQEETTNNRMELTAAISSLAWVEGNYQTTVAVRIYTDSKYLQKGICEWMPNWLKRNWHSAIRKPVKNRDLWETLHRKNQGLSVQWIWVKGHHDNPHNKYCDALVQNRMSNYQ